MLGGSCSPCCGDGGEKISAVRMRLVSAAQFEADEVAGGRPTQSTLLQFPDTPAGELLAKESSAAGFNGNSILPFPYGRWATYNQPSSPGSDYVTPQRVTVGGEPCTCAYFKSRPVSLGAFNTSEQWRARIETCLPSQQIRLVSFTVPVFNVLFFTQPDIGADRTDATRLWNGWYVQIGAGFGSGGYCASGSEFRVYDSAGGGTPTSAATVSDTQAVSIDRLMVPGTTVTFEHTQTLTRYRQVWSTTPPDPGRNTASRCSETQQMTRQYTVAVEVDLPS